MNTDRIRREISRLPRNAKGKLKKVPEAIRKEVLQGHKKSGQRLTRYCRQIGLPQTTVLGWSRSKVWSSKKAVMGGGQFRKVCVVRDELEKSINVKGPFGLQITGLGLGDLAKLVKELGNEF